MKYHFKNFLLLISVKQCIMGSLTGAVASQKVTEACKGKLKLNKLIVEYNNICLLNCKIYKSNRDESRL